MRPIELCTRYLSLRKINQKLKLIVEDPRIHLSSNTIVFFMQITVNFGLVGLNIGIELAGGDKNCPLSTIAIWARNPHN